MPFKIFNWDQELKREFYFPVFFEKEIQLAVPIKSVIGSEISKIRK